MAGQIVKCNRCQAIGASQLKGSGWITFILILFYIIPGIIYMVWRRGGLGVCGSCGSDNVILNVVAQTQASAKLSQIESTDDQVRCPECRELIRFDAKKCKHCGSAVNPNI